MAIKPPPEKPKQMRPLEKGDAEYTAEAKEITELAKQCGYKWYKGMHPDDVLPLLREVFTELARLQKAIEAFDDSMPVDFAEL